MDIVISFLSIVPDVIWAVIIASFLTLTGVFLTNRHYSKQQHAQLKHEKEQKEADRKFELRRSVYLSAAEELTLANQELMNLSNIDLAANNPADSLTGFFVATTKAVLVASDDTAKCINELLEAYSEVFFSLLAQTPKIQGVRTERNIQNDAYERYQAETSRILASMNQFTEEARAESEVWNALSSSLDFNCKQAAIAAEARDKAWEELNKLKEDFLRQALKTTKIVGKLSIPALVAIRTELGIPSNIDAYHEEFEERYLRTEKRIDKLIAEVGSDAVPD